MLYKWISSNSSDKHITQYDTEVSPPSFLLQRGVTVDAKNFSQCDCYMRSATLDLLEDPFIYTHLNQIGHTAYIFTPTELFYYNGVIAKKIKINLENLKKLKTELCLTEKDIDASAKALSDQDLKIIRNFKECPQFSRIPILHLNVTKEEIKKKYDCIPDGLNLILVNQKIINILLQLAPNEVQFFDAEVYCKDGVLTEYKLVNITHKIIGIDHDKSIPTTFGFKYLTYKPGCMNGFKLARDEEYIGSVLVTEEVKQAFEAAKIRGVKFVRPEDFYKSAV